MADQLTIKAGEISVRPKNGDSRLKRKLKTTALWPMPKEGKTYIQPKRKLNTGALLRMTWVRKTSRKLKEWANRLISKQKTTAL